MIRFLIWIGLTRRLSNGKLFIPISFAPRWIWKERRCLRAWINTNGKFYIFRNVPGVIKWVPGRLLPRRWGFGIGGLIEVGDRGG